MKIIILCNSFIGGGAEKVAADTFSILKKSTLLSVLAASCDSSADVTLSKSKEKSFFTAFFNLKNLVTFLKFLFKEKPDVIHIHNYLTELTFSVLISIRIFRVFYPVKVIQTLHDHHLTCPNSSLYNDNLKQRCTDCINNRKIKVVQNKCYQGNRIKSLFKYFRYVFISFLTRNSKVIDLFLCPSKFIQKIVIEDGIPQGRVSILRNPISEQFTEINPPAPQKDPERNINLVYLGRLVSIKSIETIIEAVQLCSQTEVNVTLDICGDGVLYNKLEMLIINKGLSEIITLRGRLSSSEIRNLAMNSDILVLPSIVFENAPLVIYEGVSLDLFPIVSNIGGMLEAIETLNFGSTFEAGNPRSLVCSIKNYIENQDAYTSKQIIAKEKVKKLCSESEYLNGLLKLYSD